MIIKEIQSFDEVMLFEMQRNKLESLSFSQAWNICRRAMPYLPAYGWNETTNRQFACELLCAIENLENSGFAEVDRRGTKILNLKLNERGIKLLSTIIFKNQERMGGQY